MRKILLLIMMCVCMSVSAQEEKEFDCYCVINHMTSLYHKDAIRIELPDNKKLDVFLDDENRKDIKFVNIADALTYMSQRGWRYVDSFTENNYTKYILAKKVKSIDEAYENINVERKKKD